MASTRSVSDGWAQLIHAHPSSSLGQERDISRHRARDGVRDGGLVVPYRFFVVILLSPMGAHFERE